MPGGFMRSPSLFATQNFDAELTTVAAQLDGAGLPDLDAARALLGQIRGELSRLRAEKLALTGERADATQNLIDAGQAFVDGAAARLSAKAEAGDADAAGRLKRACERILATLKGTTPVSDAVANVTETAAGIAADTRAAAQGAGSALPWVLGLVIVGAALYFWTQRAALRAALR